MRLMSCYLVTEKILFRESHKKSAAHFGEPRFFVSLCQRIDYSLRNLTVTPLSQLKPNRFGPLVGRMALAVIAAAWPSM